MKPVPAIPITHNRPFCHLFHSKSIMRQLSKIRISDQILEHFYEQMLYVFTRIAWAQRISRNLVDHVALSINICCECVL